jgi:hypothetical protein
VDDQREPERLAFGAGRKRFDDATLAAFGGGQDDGQPLADSTLARFFRKLETVHDRHVDITQPAGADLPCCSSVNIGLEAMRKNMGKGTPVRHSQL